jgi:hypothetical protein
MLGNRGFDAWICPNCQSKVDDSFEVCSSCGAPRVGDQDPNPARPSAMGLVSDLPASDSVIDLKDERGGPPPEWTECYMTRDHADAALMIGHLKSRGISARLICEPRALTSQVLFDVSRVLVRAKDLPRARRFIERIARRRARRRGPTEFPWDVFVGIGVFALSACVPLGILIGDGIGWATCWGEVGRGIGVGLGVLAWLSLVIWLYKIRKRTDAGSPPERKS